MAALLFASGLAAAILLLAAPGYAQSDDSPTPASETDTPPPNETIITATGDQVMLHPVPFSEPFDDPTMWTASGAWQYDQVEGYDGGSWYLHGTQRNTVSILQYEHLIDLNGALGTHLVFRENGYLPDSDLVAIDISLDNGNTWFMVDMRVGVTIEPEEDGNWVLHEVDLGDYRNQIIQLRFRINAGVTPSEDDQNDENGEPRDLFYQIDNVTIQFFDPYVEYVPALYGGPHTMMGLHLVIGARAEPVIGLVKRLRDEGWPMGTLKGTTGTEAILNEVAEISPETVIVYRSLETPRGFVDCPNESNDPILEAQSWMSGLWSYWENVDADYFEIINECLPPMEWLANFTIESMRLANQRGYCLLVFSFAGGNPEPGQYAQLMPVYEYALENPCRPGVYHGIALHAYSGDRYRLLSDSGIYLGYRHRLYYDLILPEIPEAGRLPVFLTEAGPGDGRTAFSCEDIARDVIQYTAQIQNDPYIYGFHLWNLGSPGLDWVDITNCLPLLGEYLVSFYAR